MQIHVKFAIVLMATTAALSSGQAGLLNGSFELPSGQVVIGSPAPPSFGWSVVGQIDVIQAGFNSVSWQASDGLQSIDLNGWIPGAIYQDFKFDQAGKWAIRFDMSANIDSGDLKSLEVFFGPAGGSLGSMGSFTISPAGRTRANMLWTPMETAPIDVDTATTYRLQFSSLNSGGMGPALDNIGVVQVPEPSITVLLGLSSVFFLNRRQRS